MNTKINIDISPVCGQTQDFGFIVCVGLNSFLGDV